MAKIIGFKGLRYNNEKISNLSNVLTPPYDIISKEKQEDYYNKSPYNVIRLEYPKDLEGDNEKNNKYTRAGETLKSFINENVLMQEQKLALYIYQQIFKEPNGSVKSFKGVVCLVELEEFSKKIVLPHEETLSKAKTDRFNLMSNTYSNFSQIYSLYLDSEKSIKNILDDIVSNKPDISFISEDDITQNLWIVKDEAVIYKISQGFENKQLFIADGHHRYETALNFRNKLREENPSYNKDELFNFVMMMLVDMEDEGLLVFPTHRLLKDIEGFDENDIIKKMEPYFEIEKRNDIAEIEKNLKINIDKKAFAFYTGKDYYYLITLKDKSIMDDILKDMSKSYKGLDVSILHTLILEKIFKIDKENMANQKNLTYTRNFNEAIELVKNGQFQASFLLNATKVSEIKDVSLANEKMPQKSTYFWPKLITGLVMNKFK